MTFFSNSPDLSPKDQGTESTRDFRHDLEFLNVSRGPPGSKYAKLAGVPNTQIAPWATESPTHPIGGAASGSFFDDGQNRFPVSPSFRPDTARTGASDSPDPMFFGDERRPSMASATTVSSSNSNPRASLSKNTRHKKLANFLGDDGHESSRGSDTSILTTGHRDRSTSSRSRKDRNNSAHTINNDGRPISPSSSRPRTPLPSSDVTPWLFQDFKVSSRGYSGHTQSIQVCAKTWIIFTLHQLIRFHDQGSLLSSRYEQTSRFVLRTIHVSLVEINDAHGKRYC